MVFDESLIPNVITFNSTADMANKAVLKKEQFVVSYGMLLLMLRNCVIKNKHIYRQQRETTNVLNSQLQA